MEEILNALRKSFIEISNLMKYIDPSKLSVLVNENNTSGDDVKKLDILSNDIIKNNLLECNSIKIIGSEEEDKLVYTQNDNGKYMVCYDPLDGSSNIDVNITVGTIFAIYDLNKGLDNGNDIVCAGYCLYGSSTQFILARETVKIFILNNDKFLLINDNLKIKEKGNIYSINEANKYKWLGNKDSIFVMNLLDLNYTTRWVGSMVTDCHRTLIKGGIFAYPENINNMEGKIRLLYEAYPFAFIFKIAGGKSSNGKLNILDIKFPKNIHQKTPIYLGSNYEMNILDTVIKLNN